MGHIGLTPQSVNILGGFKVGGRQLETAKKLINDAKRLEDARRIFYHAPNAFLQPSLKK